MMLMNKALLFFYSIVSKEKTEHLILLNEKSWIMFLHKIVWKESNNISWNKKAKFIKVINQPQNSIKSLMNS